jgi:hypothetical protein
MELVIGIIAVYVFFSLGGFVIEKIGEWNNKRKENLRDNIARSILKTDLLDSFKLYESKLRAINYSEPNNVNYYNQQQMKLAQAHISVLFNACPKCKSGTMIERKGRYGKFYGCSNWPTCNYVKDFKEMKQEQKQVIKENFLNDLKKAYQ